MANPFEHTGLLSAILRRKKFLAVVAVTAAVLAYLFSMPFFIPPKFRSAGVIYPANISTYGSESEVEQVLQTLQSDDISDTIIREFGLAVHYRIDTTGNPAYYSRVKKAYHNNVTISKTEFESVEIEVFDTDRFIASEIANRIIELYNRKVKRLHRERAMETLKTIETELSKKQVERDTLEAALKEIRSRHGILDYSVQTQEVMRGYFKALSEKGKAAHTAEMVELIESLKEKGGDYILLNERAWRARAEFLELKNQYENVLKEVNRKQSYSNIISKPVPADRKSYPVRWLIVLLATAASLLVSVTAIIWMKKYKAAFPPSNG